MFCCTRRDGIALEGAELCPFFVIWNCRIEDQVLRRRSVPRAILTDQRMREQPREDHLQECQFAIIKPMTPWLSDADLVESPDPLTIWVRKHLWITQFKARFRLDGRFPVSEFDFREQRFA